MVLRLRDRGRVGRRQLPFAKPASVRRGGLCVFGDAPPLPASRIPCRFRLMTRCGIVALAGRPNVGKSTLLNALVGEHLAFVSPKPRPTGFPLVGLRPAAATRFFFTDSPVLLEPEYALHQVMRAAAFKAG